jgi:hypothetical protein
MPSKNKTKLINIILFLLLLIAVVYQVFFIYAFGNYSGYLSLFTGTAYRHNGRAQLFSIWEAFGVQPGGYTLFILSLVEFKSVWLLPLLELIQGFRIMFHQPKMAHKLLMIAVAFLITVAFYGAIYNPAMLIKP